MKVNIHTYLLISSLVFFSILLSGQARLNTASNTINLDILKSPQSPASNLIGISESEISRPSDPTEFMLNLRQSTESFTSMPASYAVDIAPLWLFRGSKISFKDFSEKNDLLSIISQTAVFSFAVNEISYTDESGIEKPNSAFGMGLKFSLLRGKLTDEFRSDISELRNQLNYINAGIYDKSKEYLAQTRYFIYRDSLVNCYVMGCDSLKIAYFTKAVELEMKESEIQAFNDMQFVREAEQKMHTLADNLDFRRIRWKLDINAGVAYDFPDLYFQNRRLSKAGVWLTGGFESEKNFIFLAIARYLYNPDQVFADPEGLLQKANNQTFDWGLRCIYTINHFGISAELLYRNALNTNEIEPGWKYQLNTEYRLKNNVKLIAKIGRNFNGTISRKGNVIAAINFLFGFGGDRSLQ